MSETILGIEAGGTRTTLILSDTQGELIHQRVLGPGNFRVIGKQGLLDLLKSCANDEQDPACVCLGLAGVRDDRDHIRFICTTIACAYATACDFLKK